MSTLNRWVVVSAGSIGRRHLANIRRIDPDADITLVSRTGRHLSDDLPADRIVADLDAAITHRPTLAVICSPASLHVTDAIQLAGAGCHLLIEKPLSTTCEEAAALPDILQKHGTRALLGYVLRFSRSLMAFREHFRKDLIGDLICIRSSVGQNLEDWRKGSDYRNSVSAQRHLGGGVLLELSHEIDYLQWIFGPAVAVSASVTQSGLLDLDVEDSADLILELNTSAGIRPALLHMDMLQASPERYCTAVGTLGRLTWDGIAHRVELQTADEITTLIEPCADEPDPYMEELLHFLRVATDNSPPAITINDGISTLQVIEAAGSAAHSGRKAIINDSF